MKIPLLDLNAQYNGIIDEIKVEIDKVLRSHRYILGPQVNEFEKQMIAYTDSNNAVGCGSGTDALVLALKALQIGKGDEVITTPFTFFATAGAIHRVGATTVFADIIPETFNIDPDEIEKKITPKTKAIIAVHLFGQSADMDRIMEIARKHDLKVIEDNAQGIGCKWNGKMAGTIGDVGTLSFFPSKNLGAMGDGGMCLVKDDALAQSIYKLRVHGEDPKYFHEWVGLNSRLDTLQAAVLMVKLPYLQGWSDARRKNAEFYFENLKDVAEIKLPVIHEKAYSIFNQFTIRAERRDELQKFLQENGVGCAIYYPKALHLQDCFAYRGHKVGDFPNSETASQEVLSIPIYSELTNEQLSYIVEKIKEFYN